jgi:hypothetical protein
LAGQRLFLETVQDQFHPCRNPELVEYLEQIISGDYQLARGWTSRAVVLTSYAVVLFLAAAGLATLGRGSARVTACLIAGAISAVLARIDRFRAGSPQAQRSHAPVGDEFLTSKRGEQMNSLR